MMKGNHFNVACFRKLKSHYFNRSLISRAAGMGNLSGQFLKDGEKF